MSRRSQAPPALAGAVRQHGKTLVTNLTFALKTARLYSFAHSNVTAAFMEFEQNLKSFTKATGSAMHLIGMDECLFLNEWSIGTCKTGMTLLSLLSFSQKLRVSLVCESCLRPH